VNVTWDFTNLASILDATLWTEVESASSQWRRDWAFTRYDVVAHSQGGVLARMLCAANRQYSTDPFVSDENAYRGRFRRVITIGSPHNGSVLAYYSRRVFSTGPFLGGTFYWAINGYLQWSGLLQAKFDPFGEQIQAINRVGLDPRARFRMIRASIDVGGNSCPSAYLFEGLCFTDPVTFRKRAYDLLPCGSDGVVDLGSQGAGAGTMVTTLTNKGIAHADSRLLDVFSLFGVEPGATETKDGSVGGSVIDLLDGPSTNFDSFHLPRSLGLTDQLAIDALIPDSLIMDLIASSISPKDLDYRYEISPAIANTLQGEVAWSVEVHGPGGVTTEGINLTHPGGDNRRVSVRVADSVVGDVVLFASACGPEGELIVGKPVLVISRSPEGGMIGIELAPREVYAVAGEPTQMEVWGLYTNGIRSKIYIGADSGAVYSSSDPAALDVTTNGWVTLKGAAPASVMVAYGGFTTQAVVRAFVPPTILSQPQDQFVALGSNAVFQVLADGSPAVGFQWTFNGQRLPEATNAVLVLNAVTTNAFGRYSVIVSNAFSSAESAPAALMPLGKPVITSMPEGKRAWPGEDAAFGVAVSGQPPLVYQWQKDGVYIPMATNSALTLSNIGPAQIGYYRVIVSNAFGAVTGAPVRLSMNGLCLLHRYSFSETSGSVVHDLVGSAHGTLVNPAGATWKSGRLALGGGAHVALPSGTISALNDGTFEAWVTRSSGGPFLPWLFGFGGGTNDSPYYTPSCTNYLALKLGDLIRFAARTIPESPDSPEGPVIDAPVGFPVGISTHVAVTYDSTLGWAKLYVNGVLVGSGLGFMPLLSLPDVNNRLGGSPDDFWSNDFVGDLDEVRLYEGALSEAQIAASYSSGPNQGLPLITASFTAGPTLGRAPLPVVFSNLTTDATSYLWNFGDGKTSTDPKPANTYSNAGVYSIKLTAWNPTGTNALTRTNYILVYGAGDAPIALSGFNRDVVVEASASGGSTLPYTAAFDVLNNMAFFEAGLNTINWNGGNQTVEGLPVGGAFISILDHASLFQLPPYTSSNVLFLSYASPSGTLTLSNAAAYRSLSVLATSANGGGTGTFVIHFADGTSSAPVNYSAPDWFNNSGTALTHFGRIYGGNYGVFHTQNPADNNPNLYQTKVNLAARGLDAKPIRSLTFNITSGAGTSSSTDTGIFALSGTPSILPAPSLSISQSTSALNLTWTSIPGQNYQVQCKTNLAELNWSSLGSLISATESVTRASISVGTDRQRFYRVVALP
jgi:PKD repeat protein